MVELPVAGGVAHQLTRALPIAAELPQRFNFRKYRATS